MKNRKLIKIIIHLQSYAIIPIIIGLILSHGKTEITNFIGVGLLIVGLLVILFGSLSSMIWVNDLKYWNKNEELDELFKKANERYLNAEIHIEAIKRVSLKRSGFTDELQEKVEKLTKENWKP